jgi:putative endonuclease
VIKTLYLYVVIMFYVYIIVSQSKPDRFYIGFSSRPEDRLAEHNAGKNPSTARFAPWLFANVIGFRSKHKSLEFERYLKGGSGRAFIRRHLL